MLRPQSTNNFVENFPEIFPKILGISMAVNYGTGAEYEKFSRILGE